MLPAYILALTATPPPLEPRLLSPMRLRPPPLSPLSSPLHPSPTQPTCLLPPTHRHSCLPPPFSNLTSRNQVPLCWYYGLALPVIASHQFCLGFPSLFSRKDSWDFFCFWLVKILVFLVMIISALFIFWCYILCVHVSIPLKHTYTHTYTHLYSIYSRPHVL